MLNFFKIYPLLLMFFLAVDLLWLGGVARNFYRKHLGRFFRDKINWPAALAFYGIYIAGILIFAVLPAAREGSPVQAGIYGMLYGFFTYATYDLTNLATLRDWPGVIVVVDVLWGTVLCGISALAGYIIAGWVA
jgi:uncharacterized membrane protein